MEEEFEEIEVEEDSYLGEDEIDIDYEFDAPMFCDFTRVETFLDDAEAEQWFEFAGSYPPSPFLMKLRLGNKGAMEIEEVSATDYNNGRGLECCDQTKKEGSNGQPKALSKCLSKSKKSTFMKPTASNLAKQKNPTEVIGPRSLRFKNQSSPPSGDGDLTKRQKIEGGYLRMVSRLKHQISYTHKKPKEVDPTASRPKVTVPKEPNLVTAMRADRHKSRTNAESGEDGKSSSQTFKARPLNKKILEAPAQSFHKKKTSRVTEFNVFRLKTLERAMQHTSSNANSISSSESKDLKRTTSSGGSRQEKCRMINKLQGSPEDKRLTSKGERGVFRSIKVYPLEPNDKSLLKEPPTESFSKLSLASEAKQTTKSQAKQQPISKGLKENRPGSLHQDREMKLAKEEIQRLCGKQYHQCVNEMGSLISKHTCSMLELGH